jgi:predicted RNase H-like HicB family nuclease
MDTLVDTLHVEIEYSTEDEEYGPVYIAAFQEIRAATDARTLDELLKNIREVVDLYLDTQDDITDVRLAPNVRIMLTMELPTYAATA